MSETGNILEVDHLKQYFESGSGKNKIVVKAVDDVSLSIQKGEVFGLVGESGSGKTTLGRSIIRLYTPTSGSVTLEDKEIASRKLSNMDRKFITSRVQMIFQDPISSLNPRMTVKDIISEGLVINKTITDPDEILQKVYDMLEIVGLTKEHATRYPHEFSGGQRQRIGVARALITNPAFVIADEPVSALDVSIQAQVLNLINDLRERMGLTVLFIAHNLSVVKYFSNRIGIMYNGKIVEMGEASAIYKDPVHPYTKSLLSAIPVPDPKVERNRVRTFYDPSIHNYTQEQPSFVKLVNGRYVHGSASEIARYNKEIGG